MFGCTRSGIPNFAVSPRRAFPDHARRHLENNRMRTVLERSWIHIVLAAWLSLVASQASASPIALSFDAPATVVANQLFDRRPEYRGPYNAGSCRVRHRCPLRPQSLDRHQLHARCRTCRSLSGPTGPQPGLNRAGCVQSERARDAVRFQRPAGTVSLWQRSASKPWRRAPST